MKQRDVAVSIILTIVTCGIYGIYWFIVLTDDVISASEESFPSGAVCFILNLVTCGIYGVYWAYKMGQLLQRSRINHNMPVGSDSSIAFLLLAIFQLNIINLAIIQNEMNNFNNINHTNNY
ncbi:MAG: DUF4234 domain-containing protein [Acetivibrio sp.]